MPLLCVKISGIMDELRKNDVYEAQIDAFSADGGGVCRIAGRAVFVPRALPGEQWRVRIVKANKTAVWGRGEALLSAPSEARIEPKCPVFGRCGGCAGMHMRYGAELEFKLGRLSDALRRIGAYYGTVDGFQPVLYATRKLVWVFAALTVVCLAGAIFGKKTWMRAVGRYGAVLMALALVSAFVLSKYWTAKMLFLYLLHTVVYCLYMVYLLYRGEFFAYSLATSVSGCVFFFFSKGVAFNTRGILLGLLALAALVFVAVFAALAAKGKGVLKLGGKQVRVLPKSFNPIVLYVVCALWLVCLVLCYALGASFAYYCMFAAIAFELVAAVYYTFQLK